MNFIILRFSGGSEPLKASGWERFVVFYSATNLNNVASFSVKRGEVLNIGDLEFDRRVLSVHHAISIVDNQNDLIQYLSKYKPELLPRLQTRLIQLSPQ